MGKDVEIYCLNKRHSKIVCGFLVELEDIINDATHYDEDFEGYKKVMDKFITFHNNLGIYAILGEVDYENWYLSLPNNVYWATIGYFASVQVTEGEDLDKFKEKVFSLISITLKKLDRSLIAQSWTESEEKIHLN
jgi:hypothetical protein|tara:strand:- start:16846 stop:17250 length:405 start_codon:yes stop_codon:yes gene_type:complete